MHCHLRDSILDVGPVYSFCCFSFERYNGILERMQKTWQAPELQLIHKILNLQSIIYLETPDSAPSTILKAFEKLKNQKLTEAQEIIDPLVISRSEETFFSSPFLVSALKTVHHTPLHPVCEKYFSEVEQQQLKDMYAALYGLYRIEYIPLYHQRFNQIKIMGDLFTSAKSRTTRSAAVLATWPSVTGILSSRNPIREDLRIGVV